MSADRPIREHPDQLPLLSDPELRPGVQPKAPHVVGQHKFSFGSPKPINRELLEEAIRQFAEADDEDKTVLDRVEDAAENLDNILGAIEVAAGPGAAALAKKDVAGLIAAGLSIYRKLSGGDDK